MNVLSRRGLLGQGALVVGFSLAGLPLGAEAQTTPFPATGYVPPAPDRIDAWIVVHPDSTVTLLAGKAELGQGNSTTLLQIAGEELDLGLDQLRLARLDTAVTPNQGATVSSSSMARGGPQVRKAAAEARQALLRLAAGHLAVAADQLTVGRGIVFAPAGASVRYGDLLGGRTFDIAFTGSAPLKHPADYKLVGHPAPRLDIPGKCAGSYEYMQHARLPGMLHGRIVRPRGQGAYADIPKVLAIDVASISDIPGCQIVRRGDFVGVVAPREWDAVRAAQRLAVTWERPHNLAGHAGVFDRMRTAATADKIVVNTGTPDSVFTRLAADGHLASGSFRGPDQAHGSFAPSCALADVSGETATILCSSQDITTMRDELAVLLALPATRVRVQYYPSAGCYGHNCYDDAAEAAALMSREVGKPVRVQFMRWDELGWDNYGPAHLAEVRAAADRDGRLQAYEYHGWQHGWITTETSEQLARGVKVAEVPVSSGVGSLLVNPVNAGSMYDIPNRRIVNHQVDGAAGYLKAANLRSPLDISTSFASEQIIDALARAANLDRVAFRRLNITDPRWRGVLDAVATASNWPQKPPASPDMDVLHGRGVALGTHRDTRGAAVADITVNRRTGVVIATRMWGAIDCGLAVNPAIVESQVMGMLVQATSRMLKEAVTYDDVAVTSLDWTSYPVLRFAECPEVTVSVLQNLEIPSSGAGEEVLAAGAAAIANAFCDATGVRMTAYPLTPERVLKALQT